MLNLVLCRVVKCRSGPARVISEKVGSGRSGYNRVMQTTIILNFIMAT